MIEILQYAVVIFLPRAGRGLAFVVHTSSKDYMRVTTIAGHMPALRHAGGRPASYQFRYLHCHVSFQDCLSEHLCVLSQSFD